MKNKTSFERSIGLFVALCFVLFLFVDLFVPQASGASSAIKYAGLLACVSLSLQKEDSLLRSALLITAVCDYFLLFTTNYTIGVVAFVFVQVFHSIRHASIASLSAKKTVLPAFAVALLAGGTCMLITRDLLLSLSLVYATMLLTSLGLSIAAFFRAKDNAMKKVAMTACGGMLLFLACDISVAAFNAGVSQVGFLMWLFYLPSQYLLATSAIPAKIEEKRPRPAGWHT